MSLDAMSLDDMVVRSHPGEGLVGRFAGVAVVVVADSPRHDAMVEHLLAAAEAASATGPAPGRRLARQVAGMLASAEPDDVPAFCLMAQADAGLVIILHGSMDAVISRPNGQERLSGSQVATWVDRILPLPIDALDVTTSGQAPSRPDPRTRLLSGVVTGAGMVLLSADATVTGAEPAPAAPAPGPAVDIAPPAPTPASEAREPATAPTGIAEPAAEPRPEPEPAVAPSEPVPDSAQPAAASNGHGGPLPDAPPVPPPSEEPTVLAEAAAPPASAARELTPVESQPFVAVALADPDPEPVEARPPLPIAGQTPELHEPAGPRVRGVICSRGHFNDPAAPFCGACGISMVQRTLNLVDGPRPPLGVIVFDDGTTYTLDANYVLGREPENDPAVMSGEARPLAIVDPDRTVSRVHAELILDGWNVKTVDRGSANGTFIAGPGEDNWVALLPNRPTPVKPGTRVRLGQRVFLYDSHQGTR